MHTEGVDGLFRLPLAEFTSARNFLAARLKKSGDTDEAARVKALPKPPLSAWVVNQLYWRHETLFSRLMTTSHRLKVVQTEKLAGSATNLRAPLDAHNAVMAELTRAATTILEESGSPAAPDTIRRVITTLESLAAYGRQPTAPQAGRLTRDVDSPGFAALAALMPGKGRSRSPSRIIPFAQPDRKTRGTRHPKRESPAHARRARLQRIAEARTARRSAERALAGASRAVAKARAAMKQAAARSAAAEKRKAGLAARLEKVTADAEALRQHARRAAAHAEETAHALDEAERAVAQTRAAEKDAQSSSRP